MQSPSVPVHPDPSPSAKDDTSPRARGHASALQLGDASLVDHGHASRHAGDDPSRPGPPDVSTTPTFTLWISRTVGQPYGAREHTRYTGLTRTEADAVLAREELEAAAFDELLDYDLEEDPCPPRS